MGIIYKRRNKKMVKIPAGEFKAKCLKIMDQVKNYHEEIIITKHGKPVAKLVPIMWGHLLNSYQPFV
jgi:prevent-host-death family protein